jgi:hypothetical protein
MLLPMTDGRKDDYLVIHYIQRSKLKGLTIDHRTSTILLGLYL